MNHFIEPTNLVEAIAKASPGSTLDEVSNEFLTKYKTAARVDASKANLSNDMARGDKRFKGIIRATNKQFDNAKKGLTKEEVELDESGEYMWKIEGGKGQGKGFTDKGTTVDDHLSAMNYHSNEYQKAMKNKRDADARHHGMKYHKHKDQIENLGRVGGMYHESFESEDNQLDEAHRIGSPVEIVRGEGKGIVGHIGEIRHGSYKGAPKTYTVFHGEHDAIQVGAEHIKALKDKVGTTKIIKTPVKEDEGGRISIGEAAQLQEELDKYTMIARHTPNGLTEEHQRSIIAQQARINSINAASRVLISEDRYGDSLVDVCRQTLLNNRLAI